jgi:uncharacterized protein YndB with AHSA1/START domain
MSVTDPVYAKVAQQIEIAATPSLVFDALVSAEQLGRWWGSRDKYRSRWDVDLRVGGEYRCEAAMVDGTVMTVHGRFLEIDRPARLSYTWNASWDPTGESIVCYELTPRGEATLLSVTHRCLTDDAAREGYRGGWAQVLGWLAAWVERGTTS